MFLVSFFYRQSLYLNSLQEKVQSIIIPYEHVNSFSRLYVPL